MFQQRKAIRLLINDYTLQSIKFQFICFFSESLNKKNRKNCGYVIYKQYILYYEMECDDNG